MGKKQHAKKKSGWASVLLNTAFVHSGVESYILNINMYNFSTMLSTK